MVSWRIWKDLVCPGRMHNLGGGRDNGEGKLRVHPANLGSPER